ncbi:MAG: hypothetical protein E2O72_03465 [Candidatus Dadabacteria bacterium]|nr:MAG: hypothetical protein E2O72_03465 [Candidatus Dadabacteria bacterium]TDI98831.1 MAG: hypothetical protein E2O70_08985 [Candidatus Dadabacteria bacterium]
MNRVDPRPQNKVLAAIIVWYALAIFAGGSGFTLRMVPPLPQIVLFGLVVLLLLLYWLSQSFRKWVLSVNIKLLVALHLTRFVGFYFLFLYSRGQLPYDFAVLGGWGDIIVATAALLVILLATLVGKSGWIICLVWNLIGLVDILFVIATAARLTIADPQSMSELLKLPLSLLPTFLVPILIFTHIIIFIRLYRARRAGYIKL